MEMHTYPITVEREGRKYWAYSEDFPGVYGLGNSIEEAKASILESMRLYIEECHATHRPVPRARTVYVETVSLAV
jgi:predicted RNase H-like HicB family nuclease